jgi:hypothetical protein
MDVRKLVPFDFKEDPEFSQRSRGEFKISNPKKGKS